MKFEMSRKLILYIAMSLDGYIAKEDGNIDFLSVVEKAGEDYGFADFLQGIDTIIWGRKTFDKVLSFGIGIPHLLGDGIKLFRDGRPELGLILKRSISYPFGLVQLWYDKIVKATR
jgi:hypothetical protein